MSAGGYVPNDPTTWTDWHAPESRGFVQVDCTTGLETVLDTGWKACGTLSAGALWYGLFGGRHHSEVPTDPRVYLAAGILLGAAAVFFLLRLLTDNFYLVDPERHAVYLHAKFLFRRRVHRVLERQDIAGVATETQRSRSRYDHGTENRTVLVSRDGRYVPMSDFKKDGLEQSNNLAIALAHQLDVPCHEAPDDTRLIVTNAGEGLRIAYEPFTWVNRVNRSGLTLAVAFVLVVWAFIFVSMK